MHVEECNLPKYILNLLALIFRIKNIDRFCEFYFGISFEHDDVNFYDRKIHNCTYYYSQFISLHAIYSVEYGMVGTKQINNICNNLESKLFLTRSS